MTEAKWLAATHPGEMANHLCLTLKLSRTPKGRRKLRLYACACCRRAWHLFTNEQSRRAVDVAERYAEGNLTKAKLDREWNRGMRSYVLCYSVCGQIRTAVVNAPYDAAQALSWTADGQLKGSYHQARAAEDLAQIALLRDIFGNPFRPPSFSPSWRTDTAVALARQMYDSREFSAMPILADALQDAGCDSADILDHCRGAGLHVRGCWVVDLVLGKE